MMEKERERESRIKISASPHIKRKIFFSKSYLNIYAYIAIIFFLCARTHQERSVQKCAKIS